MYWVEKKTRKAKALRKSLAERRPWTGGESRFMCPYMVIRSRIEIRGALDRAELESLK